MIDLGQYVSFIAKGLATTLMLAIVSFFVGVWGGTLFATLHYQRFIRFALDGFVSILRGTPMILQLNFFFFVIPSLFKIHMSIFMVGIITLGLNSSAYVSEILRGGIESIPKGQFEAARTLRIPVWRIWKDIILPQVFRNTLPALVNESITLLKEVKL